jgi:hypothetical protein
MNVTKAETFEDWWWNFDAPEGRARVVFLLLLELLSIAVDVFEGIGQSK